MLKVTFFSTASGNQPVKKWLKSLNENDRLQMSEAIKAVASGWPIGPPIVKPMEGMNDCWEIREKLASRKEGRIIFTLAKNEMFLLHGFIKKSRKTSKQDIGTARSRMKILTSI